MGNDSPKALLLLFAATWAFTWGAWTAAPLRAQQTVRLDLGYAAENLLPPEALLGEWHAVINRDGHPQPIVLTIQNVTPGKTAGKMTFASPKRCVIDLEYGGPDRGRHIFYMIRFTNCFDYGRRDFVALSQVPGEDIAVPPVEDSGEKRRRAAEILDKFTPGHSGPAAADEIMPMAEGPAAVPLPPGPPGPGRIVYAINLAGEVRDSANLKRR